MAVSSGLIPVAIGFDGGGSIRIPSSVRKIGIQNELIMIDLLNFCHFLLFSYLLFVYYLFVYLFIYFYIYNITILYLSLSLYIYIYIYVCVCVYVCMYVLDVGRERSWRFFRPH